MPKFTLHTKTQFISLDPPVLQKKTINNVAIYVHHTNKTLQNLVSRKLAPIYLLTSSRLNGKFLVDPMSC